MKIEVKARDNGDIYFQLSAETELERLALRTFKKQSEGEGVVIAASPIYQTPIGLGPNILNIDTVLKEPANAPV